MKPLFSPAAFGCALSLLCAGAALVQAAAAQDAAADFASLQAKILRANAAPLRRLAAISFKAESSEVYAKPYLERNPRSARFDHLKIKYSGLIAAGKYRINTVLTLADGATLPDFSIACDGARYEYLNGEGEPWISVSSKRQGDAPNAVPLGTFVFIPYCFLFDSEYPSDFPVISAAMITSEETWRSAFQKAQATRLPTATDPTAEIKFTRSDGSTYLVVFSPEGLPTAVEKREPDQRLAVRLSVQEWKKLKVDEPDSAAFPASIHLETFLSGWLRLTEEARLTEVLALDDAPESEFRLDLGTVSQIHDEDSGTMMQMPR